MENPVDFQLLITQKTIVGIDIFVKEQSALNLSTAIRKKYT